MGSVTSRCIAKYKIMGYSDRDFTFSVTEENIDNIENAALVHFKDILKKKNLDIEDYQLTLYQ